MQIANVHIEHYRSIKDLTFEPGTYCVLIGENNAGKSNVLRGLNLVLGDAWPSERSFSEEDFHNQDTSRDIVIQVFFDEAKEEWRNQHKMEVGGLELRCHALQRKTAKKQRGDLTVSFSCITKTGKPCKYPAEPGKHKGQWMDLRVSSELRELVPFIYVDVLRDYNRQTPGSRWSILRRLFNEVNTEFLNDKATIAVAQPDGSTIKMTRRQAFESAVKDAYQYLRTKSFEGLERRLEANAIEQMGLDADSNRVALQFESHDPTNAFKSLGLYVDQMGIRSPASEVGAGLQSAIVVAIFRTYEELKKEGAVFAIEEPEVFLHPQKARYFEGVLHKLSEGGNQVLLTTHSPVFVQIHRPECVAVVRRNGDRGTWIKQASLVDLSDTDRQALRLMSEFDSERNELFFAKAVMLVEGATEKVALPLALRAAGIDINRSGLSVVEVGGKTKFPLFVRVLNAMGIPYVVLADHDVRVIKDDWSAARKTKECGRNHKHAAWNKEIEGVCRDECLYWLKPDFESELNLPRNEAEKLDQALARFEAIRQEDIPSSLRAPMDALIARIS